MSNSSHLGSWTLLVGITVPLALLLAACGAPLRKTSDSASHVVVGNRNVLYVGQPKISDTALSALEALDWSADRFHDELRKEIIFQFERKNVSITDDSASAQAWLDVRLLSYEVGKEYPYQGDARLRTANGERQIELSRKWKASGKAVRSDPTVDYIRQIAEILAVEANKPSVSSDNTETPVHMLMLF